MSRLSDHSVFKDPQKPTTPELIQLAEAGAEAWATWRRDYPPTRVRDLDLAPVYAHLLNDPANPSVDALHRLARAGRELWDAWRQRYREAQPDLQAIWSRILTNPPNPSREAQLALARTGPELWNHWRAIHRMGLVVDFSGIDFRESPVDFSGFHLFEAKFDRARFGHMANFGGASFGFFGMFSAAQFRDHANFSNVVGRMSFDGAQFGDDAQFNDSFFSEGTSFRCAQLGAGANFVNTNWGKYADFAAAHFGDNARFSGTTKFREWTTFEGAQFGNRASFEGAKFSWICFEGAQFGDDACFDGAMFYGDASWRAWPEKRVLKFWTQMLRSSALREDEDALSQALELRTRSRFFPWGSDSFGSVSFAASMFEGVANFSDRAFTGSTKFGVSRRDPSGGKPTRFCKAPNFHGCELHQDTDFVGADFPERFTDAECSEAARAYRTLKLAMNKHQAMREEQLFFKLEMKAEAQMLRMAHAAEVGRLQPHVLQRWFKAIQRPSSNPCVQAWREAMQPPSPDDPRNFRQRLYQAIQRNVFERWVQSLKQNRWRLYRLYEAFADYGLGVARPVLWLLGLSFFFFFPLYSLFHSPLHSEHTAWEWDWNHAWELVSYTMTQLVPLAGLGETAHNLERSLFAHLEQSPLLLFFVMTHKALALLFLFLIGLGLRNTFKMK